MHRQGNIFSGSFFLFDFLDFFFFGSSSSESSRRIDCFSIGADCCCGLGFGVLDLFLLLELVDDDEVVLFSVLSTACKSLVLSSSSMFWDDNLLLLLLGEPKELLTM